MAAIQAQPPAPYTVNEMSRIVQLIFGSYMVALNIAIIYLLVAIWPDKIPLVDSPESVNLFFGRVPIVLSPEVRFLLITILAGALGSYIHAATSFVDFIGNRQFVKSWTWWYLLRPFIGVALALLVYFAARGGLISASTGANGLSPYGVAALSGMAGLFSKQATDKLREVFETLFKTDHPPERNDKLTN
jgi:NADH:ubiquinone oxidoreductase subunit 6 (subunit J)